LIHLKATYVLSSPAMLGGGDADAPSGRIRATSFKGAMRYWWRAIFWHTLANKSDALEVLHRQEMRLFGSTDGQGCFLLSIDNESRKQPEKLGGLRFLLGVMGGKEQGALSHGVGTSFTASLLFKKTATDQDVADIVKLLEVLGCLAGIGKRSRRGFGALTLQKIEQTNAGQTSTVYRAPKDAHEYVSQIKEILKAAACSQLPAIPALSDKTAASVAGPFKDWNAAMVAINSSYSDYRNLIKTGDLKMPNGNLVKKSERQVFGLPIKGQSNDRRSSPLYMRVAEVSGQYYVLKFSMPAKFNQRNEAVNWALLNNFISASEWSVANSKSIENMKSLQVVQKGAIV